MNGDGAAVIPCNHFDAWHVVYLVHSNQMEKPSFPQQVSNDIFEYYGITMGDGKMVLIDVKSSELRVSGFDQDELEVVQDLIENFEMNDAIEYIKVNQIDGNQWEEGG